MNEQLVLEESLTDGIEQGFFPTAIAGLKREGESPILAMKGVHEHTVFDVASLTKVVVTLPAILLSVQAGKLSLFDRVARHIPEFTLGFDREKKEQITLHQLLTHTSGLPAWRPLFITCQGRQAYIEAIGKEPLIGEPGKQVVYSDLGFMLLGFILERTWDLPLEEIAKRLIFQPFSMNHTGYGTRKEWDVAPTEEGNEYEKQMAWNYLQDHPAGSLAFTEEEWKSVPWRKGIIQGAVHDGNAHYGLGGVSGHAGLFSTVGDLLSYMKLWSDPAGFYLDLLLRDFAIQCQSGALAPRRALGWEHSIMGGNQEQKARGCSGGDLVSASGFGHTGFTGTSIWHDPKRQATIVTLTNRVHPKVKDGIIRWRHMHHNRVFACVGLGKQKGGE
ncbi:serine hydrolase [Ammoniphilus sp. YIM 78166]|uniref:serine hydrolase domain-containing protein n=1 Tax=Ammoniphilus sp. YIM 78166 TaxID=1644106 RepID=UPI001070544B|nr:serine hydrolase domain-containing protein [Ammoniphilus sp. YIM 78166]